MKTTKIRSNDDLFNLISSKEMYFYDDFNELMIRTEPLEDGRINYFLKRKGRKEYYTDKSNVFVFDAVYLFSDSITKEDYDKY